jgi:prepilin-type N-terminal cleavage/methylation domain-containing protein
MRRGVTLIELLIVITIIALLLTLFLPAIYMVRQASLRTACESNLRQIYLAAAAYSDVHKGYLPFPAVEDQPSGWAIAILPYMEEIPLYNSFDPNESIVSPRNLAAAKNRPPLFMCPVVPYVTSPIDYVEVTNYLLVVDEKDRTRHVRGRRFQFKDVPLGARFPWCTSPEMTFEEAKYERPHENTEAVFGF